jgi:hypothetical protein
MGIIDRLGNVLKSYLNDDDGPVFGKRERHGGQTSGDSDYDEAYAELNDFLKGEGGGSGKREEVKGKKFEEKRFEEDGAVPVELRGDFEALGVPVGASEEVCKDAYKKLLKIHHPDRHAGHEGNMKKATEKSARINAAYDRIAKWRKGEPL